jgi:hydroxymethylglutaryl-CoA lyase
MKRDVSIQDVSPRDGLQNETQVLSPGRRIELIELLAASGLPRIQIGAFVNPTKVPQMAGAKEVFSGLAHVEGVEFSALVLNERGLKDATAAGLKRIEIFVSASEAHSLKNSGVTVKDALRAANSIISIARGNGLRVTAGVMCAMGCLDEGPIPSGKVLDIIERLMEAAADDICIADTTGLGRPSDVEGIFHGLGGLVPARRLGFHFHDTYGRGLENLGMALDLGARRFDTSLGGLGGCPFVEGAKGNISTEAALELIKTKGLQAGVDQGALLKARKRLETILGRTLPDSGTGVHSSSSSS